MALTMVKPEEMEAQAGTKLPPGEWFEIDQERINTSLTAPRITNLFISTRLLLHRHPLVAPSPTAF